VAADAARWGYPFERYHGEMGRFADGIDWKTQVWSKLRVIDPCVSQAPADESGRKEDHVIPLWNQAGERWLGAVPPLQVRTLQVLIRGVSQGRVGESRYGENPGSGSVLSRPFVTQETQRVSACCVTGCNTT
jgi:hypothetical protein